MNSPLYLDYVEDAQTDDPGDGRPTRLSRGWKALGWTSVALSGLLVVGCISAYAYVRTLDPPSFEPPDPSIAPAKLNESMNILLLGSDTRAGEGNAKYGKSMTKDGARADTTILMHLSPGGTQMTGISFPRDLMVNLPACKKPDGSGSTGAYTGMINEAFFNGGPACTWKTIQALTGIHIDHMAVVDFSGFKGVVNALGGVEICLPKAVNDPQSKLNLPKGKQKVNGENALAYVRNRKGLGDGSDLSRIKRQQQFLGSVAKKALSKGVLTDPLKLNALVRSATKTVQVDKGFTLSEIVSLGTKMQGIDTSKIRFVTVPWEAYTPDPNRVQLSQPDANKFFTQIRNDTKIEDLNKKPAAVTVPASQIKVRVLNGSGVTGQAGRVAEALKAKGFQLLPVGNPKVNPPTTQIAYGADGEAAAQTLAAQVPGAKLVPNPKLPAGTVELILGPGFAGLSAKTVLPTKLDGEIKATDNICKAT